MQLAAMFPDEKAAREWFENTLSFYIKVSHGF